MEHINSWLSNLGRSYCWFRSLCMDAQMTKIIPPSPQPTQDDLKNAHEFLFPDMPGSQIYTNEERSKIYVTARQIMMARITKH